MRFSQEDIQRFAEWSSDRNPIHIDLESGRRSYFGQTITHGMLSVLGAIASGDSRSSDLTTGLEVEFKGAVRPDVAYDLDYSQSEGDTQIVLRSPEAPVLAIRLERTGHLNPSAEAPWTATALRDAATVPSRVTPVERTDAELEAGLEVLGVYTTPEVPEDYIRKGALRPLHARVLALCSYLVGMEVPGLKSLFTRASLQFFGSLDDSPSIVYRARTTRFDRQFRMLETHVEVATPEGRVVAVGTLRSYVRFGQTETHPSTLAARLSPSTKALTGQVALVLGGTRGLGADLVTALTVAGCRVYASFHRDRDAAADLQKRLATVEPHAELLQGDAGDAEWCRSALERIQRECGRLDLLILNACAPPVALRLAPSTAERNERYVAENLRLVQTPLAVCLPAIQESGGAIAYISSSFVEEPPAGFGAYVAVKQAAEGLLRSTARESGLFDTLIVRPPRLQTSWNDTPTGVLGAIPADWVASHVVNRLGEGRGKKSVELLASFPPFPHEQAPVAASAPAEFTLTVAAGFTIDPLLSGLRFWLQEIQVNGEVVTAPYGQVVQTLLDPTSAFASTQRGLNLLLLRVGDWLRDLHIEATVDQDLVRAHLEQAASDFERAMRAHRARRGNSTILIICPSAPVSPALDSLIALTEEQLTAGVKGLPGLQIVAAKNFHDRYGVSEQDVHDPLRDRIGHIPYRDEYFHVLAAIATRHAHRQLSPARKVVVVDADNTIWRGVVGEVGAEGVVFDEGHRALHRTLVRLAASGILIAICSKNEADDVWEVFDTRPDFELRREHIVGAAINWLPKSQNLHALASRLNLGLDSFIFIDDNPIECAEVRAHCPEVLTLQWPQDPAAAIRLLEHTWELDSVDATAEDLRRTEMYREELQRQTLREGALTLRNFLDSLALVVDITPLTPDDLRRASQLTLRTNQFNFTTRRRDEAEVQALVSGGTHEIRTVRVRDRFGDYGLVGLVIAEWQSDVLEVDTFLLSCRVLGRGVEHHMAAELGRLAHARGTSVVRMRVDFTKKNTPARQFLQAIIPSAYLSTTESGIDSRMPAAELADLRFEPSEGADEALGSGGAEGPAQAAPVDASRLRTREAEILRASNELSTVRGLMKAVSGGIEPKDEPRRKGVSVDAVADTVYKAFASVLRVPVTKIKELDALEALGCDSLKIVEITVELTGTFPSVPPTLLFEHRSVSEIAQAIALLQQPVPTVVRAGAMQAESEPVAGRSLGQTHTAIAVVGMHLRCAGANSPAELWELLSHGRSAVKAVPTHRRHFLHPLADKRPHWAGLLDEVGVFDTEFFGVSPREAEYMDPQLRLFLEVAWSALEDAGCAGADREPDTGVFAGVMYGDYGSRVNLGSPGVENPYRCWEGFSLANRLSQLLGFNGPSLAVDTACSSSGTALHLACTSLKAGECRVAIVGGVNLILDPDRFASLGRLGILSAVGRCEPFGADADGTVLGEGAGVVVLRPLDEAIRRGDRIHGIIKGTGLSTGSGTVGFTAPNPQAQAAAIRRSLQASGIDPRTISYVETHGTGTALGDPIEVRGLTLAYESPDLYDSTVQATPSYRLGSIKPNIGHLEAGAGVLGLIKILLQLQHRMLVPSITSDRPNPQIPFARGPFDVQRDLAEWRQPVIEIDGKSVPAPRRAGLSSFGVGGANAHVIVEESPTPGPAAPRASAERPLHVLALSARHEAALQQQVVRLRQYLNSEPDVSASDVCYSVNTGRKHFEHRIALTAATRDDMYRGLVALDEGLEPQGLARGLASGATPKIGFLFTGQGSQYPGMGRELYETEPTFRRAIDRCAKTLDTLLDRPLLDVLFAKEGTPDADLINQTGYTQPALFAFEYALSQLWHSWGITPDFVLGHSVGEIAAMCFAGGIGLDDALALVAARGRLMQALPPGGVMTSVMANETRVREAIAGREDRVAIAAINAPGQVVLSGDGAAVAGITDRLNAEGVKTKALTVSHAFHSPLMKPMLAEYSRLVDRIRFSLPSIRVVSCVDAAMGGREMTQPQYWLRNVTDPVRFADGMRALETEGVNACIEMGPHPVLIGMGRQSVSNEAGIEWLPSLRKDGAAWPMLLDSMARLYVRGGTINWRSFDAPYARQRVSAPTYAFTGKEYWARDLGRSTGSESAPSGTREQQSGQGASYELVWQRAELGATSVANRDTRPDHWVIFADQRGVGVELERILGENGTATTTVVPGTKYKTVNPSRYQIDPSSGADFERLWADVTQGGATAPRVVHLWNLDATPSDALALPALDRATALGLSSTVHLIQALTKAGVSRPTIWSVTQRAVSGDGLPSRESVSVAQSPIWGFGRTAALEHPDLWGGLIDVAHDDPGSAAQALALELVAGREDQVALTQLGRSVARLIRTERSVGEGSPEPGPALRSDSTYLVTGGVGALGLHVAGWLVAKGARHLVLVSRRAEVNEHVTETIASLERAGAVVSIVRADVSKPTDVEKLFAQISAGPAPLGGIVHAAGVDATIPLSALTSTDIDTALAAKVKGGWLLHERTRHLDLDLFVLFSSISSVLGAQGRAHYSAANAFLDALAYERRRLGLTATSINWGPWHGGGMAAPGQLEQFERIGNHGLQPAQALRWLASSVRSRDTQIAIADIDWTIFRPIYESRRARPMLDGLEPGEPLAPSALESRPAPPSVAGTPKNAPTAWIETLHALPAHEREEALAGLLQHEVAETLGFDSPGSVALNRSFYEMGMDSLVMADLVSRLNKRVGISCSALVFEYPDVRSLASKLMDRLSLAAVEPVSEPAEMALVGADFAGRVPRSGPAEAAAVAETERVGRAPQSGAAEEPLTGHDPAAEPEIFAFQAAVFPQRAPSLIPARWRWMFVESARRLGRAPLVWLRRDAGAIVGHMGSIPVRLKIGDEERDTGWLVDTMVLADYRNRAVGSRLMVDAHESQPLSLSLGQTEEMREICVRLGWRQIAPLQVAQLLVRPENVLKSKLPSPAAYAAGLGLRASTTVRDWFGERRQFDVRTIERFDERHDALWALTSRSLTCAVVRDASYFNWKYVDQPGQRILRLDLLDGTELKGVAVWVLREADDIYRYRRAFLADIVTPLSDGTTLRQVIRTACSAAAAAGSDALLCHHIDGRLTDALRDCGFHLRKPERFLLVDPGPLDGATRERALAAGNWFVTQGDSDIDRPW